MYDDRLVHTVIKMLFIKSCSVLSHGVTVLIFAAAVSLAVGQTDLADPVRALADVSTVNAVEVRSILTQAKEESLRIPNQHSRDRTLDQIGAEEARAGDLDAAIDIANRVYPSDQETQEAIGREAGNGDDWDKVQSAISKLNSSKDFIFMALVRRLAERGKIEEVLRASSQIADGDYRANALSIVALKQSENGDDSSARKTLEMARQASVEGGVDANDIRISIAKGQLLRGDTHKARATMNSIQPKYARAFALITGARILWNRSDRANAVAWLDDGLKIEDKWIRDRSLLPRLDESLPLHEFALPLQVRLGQTDAAMRYAEGLDSSQRLHDFNVIALACVEIKDKACVDAAVEKIWSTPLPQEKNASSFEKIYAIESVASALADHNEFDDAQRLFTVLENRPDRTNTPYLETAVIRARQGDFQEALKWALWVSSDPYGSPRSDALRRIALLQTKKSGAASCREWVAALTQSDEKAYALLGIAQGMLREDDRKPHSSTAGGWIMSPNDPVVELKDTVDDAKTTAQTQTINSAGIGTPKPAVELQVGESRFQIKVEMGAQTMTMKLSTIIADSGDTWTATDLLETAWGVTTDTAKIEKGTLILLRRSMAQSTDAVDLDFSGNKATGKLTTDGKDQPIAVDLGGPLFADGAGGDEVLACLPLAVGYSISFRNFDARLQKITPKQLNVVALETVHVPAGSFEAFRVEVVSADSRADKKTVWISKESRKVVKITAAYSSANGAVMTQELTE